MTVLACITTIRTIRKVAVALTSCAPMGRDTDAMMTAQRILHVPWHKRYNLAPAVTDLHRCSALALK